MPTTTTSTPSIPTSWYVNLGVDSGSATLSADKKHEKVEEASRQQRTFLCFYRRNSEQGMGYGGEPNFVVQANYTNIQEMLAKFFVKAWTEVKKIDNWRHYCIGIYSSSDSVLHFPMLDYDGKGIRALREDIKKLQKEFKLGPATIYSTKRGFHVYFSADEISWGTYEAVLDASTCDPAFKAFSKKNGGGVLRFSAKYTTFDIAYVETLRSGNHHRPWRTHTTGRLVDALIRMGAECGTHIAFLYPNLAKYYEDPLEWKPRKKLAGAKKAVVSTYIPTAEAKIYCQDALGVPNVYPVPVMKAPHAVPIAAVARPEENSVTVAYSDGLTRNYPWNDQEGFFALPPAEIKMISTLLQDNQQKTQWKLKEYETYYDYESKVKIGHLDYEQTEKSIMAYSLMPKAPSLEPVDSDKIATYFKAALEGQPIGALQKAKLDL